MTDKTSKVWVRVDYVLLLLDVYGFVNASHIARLFGVTRRTATDTLRLAQAMHPSIDYDAGTRTFRRPVVAPEDRTRTAPPPYPWREASL